MPARLLYYQAAMLQGCNASMLPCCQAILAFLSWVVHKSREGEILIVLLLGMVMIKDLCDQGWLLVWHGSATLSGKFHALLLLPLVAEPHPHNILFKVKFVRNGSNFLSARPGLNCKVGLKWPLLRCGYGSTFPLFLSWGKQATVHVRFSSEKQNGLNIIKYILFYFKSK